MIGEVNRALRELLRPAGCAVRFRPGEDDALLFSLVEVREDEKAAETEWSDIRDDEGRVVARRPPVRRFDLHYLVTAENTDEDREALLLDAVLTAVDPGKAVPTALAPWPVTLRLGDRVLFPAPRATLSVIANAPLVLPPVTEVPAPAENIRLGVAAPGRPLPAPARPRPRRWRGAAIEEGDDAVRGEDG